MSTPSGPTDSKPVLREHVFDGIEEFDQKLPNWWLFTLYGAIVFSAGYWIAYFQLNAAPTDYERLDPLIAKINQEKMESMMAMLNDENLVKMSHDQAVVTKGKAVYTSYCVACHGPNLKGRNEEPPAPGLASPYIGLSLVDEEWKYGAKPTDIYKMIYHGSPPPAAGVAPSGPPTIPMPPKGGAPINEEAVAQVTAFVLSLHPQPVKP